MGGASGGGQRSSSSTSVPAFQKPYLKDLYARAQGEIANTPLQFYPGSTVAGRDAATLGYESDALGYARDGGPSSSYLNDVVSGKYLDPASNPYLRGTFDLASKAVTDNYRDAVLPAINSRFALAGQSGSGNFAGAFARSNDALGGSLRDLGTQIYGGAYEAERGRQQQAAPLLAADRMNRLDLQRGIGSEREAYQQSLLDDLIARFDFQQNEPALRLSRYAQLLGNPITLSQSSSRGWNGGFNILMPGGSGSGGGGAF